MSPAPSARLVRIRVSPPIAASMNLSLEACARRRARDQNLPKGGVSADGKYLWIDRRATISCSTPPNIREIVVAWRKGAPVRLRGCRRRVVDSVINTRLAGWYKRSARRLAVGLQAAGRERVRDVDQSKPLWFRSERWLPPSVKVHIVLYRTLLMRASIVGRADDNRLGDRCWSWPSSRCSSNASS